MSQRVPRASVVAALVLGIISLLPAPGGAQTATGVVEGQVVDNATGAALPGARVTVQGVSAETATDRQGRFQIAAPAGPQTLVVSYLGRQDQNVTVDVTASASRHVDVQLGLLEYKEAVTVSAGLIADAQSRALNQQRTAPNITNVISADQIGAFPDRNAAEATQRVPGVSITKDQGEGRYVSVRGTEARL